jgi:KDO2-lipid IV(A) lauroyltransferase
MKCFTELGQRLVAGAAWLVRLAVERAPLPLVTAFAGLAARIAYLAWGSRRRTALENLRASGLAPDDATARRLARESFRTFCLMVGESIVARRRLTPANWREHVTVRLSPEAAAALADPRQGVILASAHLGNWEVAARAFSMLRPLMVVHRPFSNPHLEAVAHGQREGSALRVVSRLKREPLRFLEALHRGESVALMIDQHVYGTRTRVEFFGRPAWTTKSVAMLHLLTRAPLLAALAVRTGPLRYEAHVVGPVRHPRTGDRERDAQAITQALTAEIERVVRAHPGQYMWGHRRWKE